MTVVALVRQTAPQGQLVHPEPVYRMRRAYGGVTPDEVASVLQQLRNGYVSRWADLSGHMLRVDGKLRGLYATRTDLDGVPWDVDPGEARTTEDKQLADDAAAFIRYGLKSQPDLEQDFGTILHGIFPGWSVHEIEWVRDGGGWLWDLHWIHARRFRFVQHFKLELYDDGANQMALDPERFLVHTPQPIAEYPVDSGESLSVVWYWLLKTWGWKFWAQAAEKFGNPLAVGKVPRNAPASVRASMLSALESLSSDQAAVIEGDDDIEIKEPKADISADVWDKQITAINREMSLSILGYDNVDQGNGERSQSQTQTLEKRQRADSRRLNATLQRLFRLALRFNKHLFYGRMPPVPSIRFRIGQQYRPIAQSLIDARGVSTDELRISSGLSPWGPERGGDLPVNTPRPLMSGDQPAQPAQPAQANQPEQPRQPEGGDAAKEPAAPTAPSPKETTPAEAAADGQTVSEAALNGAQVTALLEIVAAVAEGRLPRDSGVEMMLASFPLSREQAERIMGEVGQTFFAPAAEPPTG